MATPQQRAQFQASRWQLTKSVGAVVHPTAGGGDPLACGDRGSMADQRDQISVAACLDANDAKAAVGVLVCDTLDQPGEHLPVRRLGFYLHDGCRPGGIGGQNSAEG